MAVLNNDSSSAMNKSAHNAIYPAEDSPPPARPPDSNVGLRALKAVRKVERHFSSNSRVYSEELEQALPKFAKEELVLGTLLGAGGFNNVYQVSRIKLSPDMPKEEKDAQDSGTLQRELAAQSGKTFAVKFLNQKTLCDPDRYCIGAADLVLEMHLLASLDHEHILKLVGLSAAGTKALADPHELSYFLLFDALETTLDKRMLVWQEEEAELLAKKKMWMPSGHKKKMKQATATRLTVALHVAQALAYLHDHRIIYRDLKPENIGFTPVTNHTKLFDFGLAKELKEGSYDEKYHLTGHTGSLRYMAPEVSRYLPYNLSADSYSFGILLWHILSLEIPFEDMSKSAHSHLVVYGGHRPTIPPTWSDAIRKLLEQTWEEAPYQRPRLSEICTCLESEIASLGGTSAPPRRTGPFVLNRDAIQNSPPRFVAKVWSRHSLSRHASRAPTPTSTRPIAT